MYVFCGGSVIRLYGRNSPVFGEWPWPALTGGCIFFLPAAPQVLGSSQCAPLGLQLSTRITLSPAGITCLGCAQGPGRGLLFCGEQKEVG